MENSFIKEAFNKFDKQWALVTAGVPGDFNTMTISWGGLGTLWSLPVATVYVRPSRYTHGFMEREGLFTVSFFDPSYKKDLGVLGTKSGRDCDKVALTQLDPQAVETQLGQTVTFKQAELTLVCRKIFRQDIKMENISKEVAEAHYAPDEKPHTMYIGEVIRVIPSSEL